MGARMLATAVLPALVRAAVQPPGQTAASGGQGDADSSAGTDGFLDCSKHSLPRGAVSRAWRKFMLDGVHPDVGGSTDVAADANELRARLSDPLRAELEMVLVRGRALAPMGSNTSAGSIRQAWANVERVDGWPYITANASLLLQAPLSEGATWTVMIGKRGLGFVHYKGDEKEGGYDVCCEFMSPSSCKRRAVTGNCADGQACGEDGLPIRGRPYAEHDCPLPSGGSPTIAVRKPLYQDEPGQWGLVLEVRDMQGKRAACVAFAFQVEPLLAPSAVAEGAPPPRPAPGPGDNPRT